MAPNKFCFILRGLPGIGKDIVSNYLELSPQHEATILSTDSYFQKDGKFQFDKTKLQEAHKATFEAFKQAISNDTPVIIVNNTNIKRFHYYHYLDYAQRHGYIVSIVTIPHNDVSDRELATRNIHGVNQIAIGRMRREFEWSI